MCEAIILASISYISLCIKIRNKTYLPKTLTLIFTCFGIESLLLSNHAVGWPDIFKSCSRSKYFFMGLSMSQQTSHRKFQPDWSSNFFSRPFLIFLKSLNNGQKSKRSKWVEIEISNIKSNPHYIKISILSI